MQITEIQAKEIKDSRGVPTVEVVMSSGDVQVRAAVPSGKSAGSREALELRDEDGKGVTKAIVNVNDVIAPALVGQDVDTAEVDRIILKLDGTDNKSNLGANALLGVSIAATKLAAAVEGVPTWKYISTRTGYAPAFPKLYMNMINGGAHADFRLPFQEYIAVVGGRTADEAYQTANEIYEKLGEKIHAEYGDVVMGDEGGYSPEISDIEKPFELLTSVVGDHAGIFLAIDAAATEFQMDGKYVLSGAPHTAGELLGVYQSLMSKFNLKSVEDPFGEQDFEPWAEMMKGIKETDLVVGDDLTVTNPKLITEMAEAKRANAVIIKPNQIGTLSEVYEAVRLSREAGWKIIVSHRSGETTDAFIADLAVGIGAFGLKAGAPSQEERRVKYERLAEISKEFE